MARLRIADRRLYLLFTPGLCAADPWDTLRAALDGGVDLVQWRVKPEDREGLARCLRICAAAEVPVIVNDDVSLAIELDAHGAHVGQDDLAATEARPQLRDRWLGVSTHDPEQARVAVATGADYIGVGPCFPTETKGYAEALPRGVLTATLAASAVPAFAIGGIGPDNVTGLLECGVRRVAVSRAVLASGDPESAAAALLAALDSVAD